MSGFDWVDDEKTAEEDIKAMEPSAEPSVPQLETGLPKWTDEQLEEVFDALMFEGSYNEEVSVNRKLKVIFRTRSGEQARDVMMRLDNAKINMGLTVEGLRSLFNLAHSLVVFNGNDLSKMKIDARLKRIEELPSAVIGTLIAKLVEFDIKVEQAVRHGEENF